MTKLFCEGRLPEVRILFTKYHEEVTSVKKSVTQVTVEASSRRLEGTETPVIELNPEVPATNRTSTAISSRRLPALSALVEKINDIVVLHDPLRKDNPSQVTYSMTEALRSEPLRERYAGENTLPSKCGWVGKHSKNPHEYMSKAPSLVNDERIIRYNATVQRFVATQEMTKRQNRAEKKLTIEIDV